jgi:chromosomal replication initiation ATPase DnaA
MSWRSKGSEGSPTNEFMNPIVDHIRAREQFITSEITRLEKLQQLEKHYQTLRDKFMMTESETVNGILLAVCVVFDVSKLDLMGPRGKEKISDARQAAMMLIRNHTDWSLERIGELFGNRDHGTVLYACRACSNRIGTRKDFTEKVRRVEEMVTSK